MEQRLLRPQQGIWDEHSGRAFRRSPASRPAEAKKYGPFRSWFNASYLQAQGLAVRRQVEARDDVVVEDGLKGANRHIYPNSHS